MKTHAPSWRPIGGLLVRVDEDPEGRDAARAHLRHLVRAATVDALGLTGSYDAGTIAHLRWRDAARIVIRRAPPECDFVLIVDIVAVFGAPLRIAPWTELAGLPVGDQRVPALVALISAVRADVELDVPTRNYLAGDLAKPLDNLQELELHDRMLAPGEPYR